MSTSFAIFMLMKNFVAVWCLLSGSLLFTACGPEGREESVDRSGTDSAAGVQAAPRDSVVRTESANVNAAEPVAPPLDSATLMNTLKILDSIAAAKNN